MIAPEDQQEYFDDLEFTFGTRGWLRLTEEMTKQIYQLQADALEKSKDYSDVMYLRGQAEMLAKFITLPSQTSLLRESLHMEDSE